MKELFEKEYWKCEMKKKKCKKCGRDAEVKHYNNGEIMYLCHECHIKEHKGVDI